MGKESLLERNANVLIELILAPDTPPHLQVRMMQKLIENKRENTFFTTMFTEMVTYGDCPNCGHNNHWGIPEEELNKIGYVTYQRDSRVKRNTKRDDCSKWGEACIKKKLTV